MDPSRQPGEQGGVKAPDTLWQEIEAQAVPAGMAVLWWLYQAGIVVKSAGGTIVAVDPYLSDAAKRSYDQPRNVPAPLEPAGVRLDAVLASHSHEDHLDPDSIAGFASHATTRFVGPPMATAKVIATGVDPDRTVPLARGARITIGDIGIRAVHARHPFAPEPVPDAIGFVLDVGEVSIYHSGDTEYDSEIVADASDVTVALIAINGTAGNMNAHEAALLAWRLRARLAVPFHYGLWRDAGYGEGATIDPQLFVDTYRRLHPAGRTLVLEPGRAVVLDGTGSTN
jgi:L-ascorbate 6-phosphate lactonase